MSEPDPPPPLPESFYRATDFTYAFQRCFEDDIHGWLQYLGGHPSLDNQLAYASWLTSRAEEVSRLEAQRLGRPYPSPEGQP